MNYSKLTLGELLSSENKTIKRNAMSILKQAQKDNSGFCQKCGGRIFTRERYEDDCGERIKDTCKKCGNETIA